MTEMFPDWYPAGDQEQKAPETEHLATTGEFQEDSLLADPEALQEEKGRLSRGMGNLALEASGVATPESNESTTAEIAARDSSDSPKEKLSPADELRARLAGFQDGTNKAAPEAASSGDREKARADLLAVLRGGNKKSADTDTQSPEDKAAANESTDDRSESNTQDNEQQSEMSNEQLREAIDSCLQATQSAREGLDKAMQSIDIAVNALLGVFQAGLSFADGNLNQVGDATQVFEKIASQKEIALFSNSVNEVQSGIKLLYANARPGVRVDSGYLLKLRNRVDEMVRFVTELRERQNKREQDENGNTSDNPEA